MFKQFCYSFIILLLIFGLVKNNNCSFCEESYGQCEQEECSCYFNFATCLQNTKENTTYNCFQNLFPGNTFKMDV